MDLVSISVIGGIILMAGLAFFIATRSRENVFDHDGDGRIGGSLPAAERGLDDLTEDYRALFGRKPDRRWGEATLRRKIAARQAGNE